MIRIHFLTVTFKFDLKGSTEVAPSDFDPEILNAAESLHISCLTPD